MGLNSIAGERAEDFYPSLCRNNFLAFDKCRIKPLCSEAEANIPK